MDEALARLRDHEGLEDRALERMHTDVFGAAQTEQAAEQAGVEEVKLGRLDDSLREFLMMRPQQGEDVEGSVFKPPCTRRGQRENARYVNFASPPARNPRPAGGGHKGDLPKLEVDAKGKAKVSLKVEGLKLEDVMGRSVMIHEGGDNYSNQPKPLGGGRARVACGVILAGKAAPAEAAGHEGHHPK